MIISASRRTDLPAWYYDWFLERLRCGSVLVRNPFSFHQVSEIPLNPDVVDGIVFWSKNPASMLRNPELLREYPFYIQFTLNAYGRDVEPFLPELEARIQTFERLAGLFGQERVLWRYDPVFLSGSYSYEWHREAFSYLCSRLAGKTALCTFSFLDFYARIRGRIRNLGIMPWTKELQKETAALLSGIASEYRIPLVACAEEGNFSGLGIGQSCCIDAGRLEKIGGISLKVPKDRTQRPGCGCCESVDIGQYDTCPGGCAYCYANTGGQERRERLRCREDSPLLCTEIQEKDRITLRKVRSFRDGQLSFELK